MLLRGSVRSARSSRLCEASYELASEGGRGEKVGIELPHSFLRPLFGGFRSRKGLKALTGGN